ncbi:tetratricopeptide repeat protein [Streptomyces sp. NPDC007088]|uniref:serine/threonine-protein kinase n=1 Tax=Streptomyces sp. NPDC007088 TaxID=3364773 RepID=UPI0036C0D8B4
MSERQCQRPGCEGAYEDMGGGELYCDTCGLAPVVSPDGLIASPPTGLTGASGGAGASGAGSPPAAPASPTTHSTGSSRSSRSAKSSKSSRRSVSARLSGRVASRSVTARGASTGSAASARGRLGVGLVTVPTVPRPDPRQVVQENPEVPERKRFCSRGDCGAPVGRSRGGRPGRTEGFCTKCGHPYSFVPKLTRGMIVHGQYEVVGCLAHGGLGWVYLAIDRAVSDRWVVLKGLLDTGDQDAMAAAISERRFLAEIEHSNIVRIYNFVEHLDQRTGSLDGYIVMEYVGGKSLKEIANARRNAAGLRDPLPVEQACAFGIEALDALGHLHSRSLLYCDFKVDNAIQTEDQLKLIDMGAVRRMDDEESAIYGTVGYQAPEVAEVGPSVASDLYTVARTLAVLTFDFQGYTTVYADSLPDPDHIGVFRAYESFYRLLVRATDPDPARRFGSAQEMSEQLTGVLREVVALQTDRPRPALSTLFGPELGVADTELFVPAGAGVSRLGLRSAPLGRRARRAALAGAPSGAAGVAGAGLPEQAQGGFSAALPAPGAQPQALGTGSGAPAAPGRSGATLVSPPDASAPASPGPATAAPAPAYSGGLSGAAGAKGAAGALRALDAARTALALPVPRVDPGDPNAGFLAGLMASAPAELISALHAAPGESLEVRLRELRARLDMGQTGSAAQSLADLESRYPDDWRVVWYRGVTSLVSGDRENAALAFDAVYDAFPGESAPKLALGLCAEELGQLDNAAEYYRLVWVTDPGYVSAAFGLARVHLAAGDRRAAVRALESVPEVSIHYTAARVAAVRARLRGREAHEPVLEDLRAAARQVEALEAAGLDGVRKELLTAEVLGTALDWVLSGNRGAPSGSASGGFATGGAPGQAGGGTAVGGAAVAPPGTGAGTAGTLLGHALDERGLRFGLERAYRTLARLARSGEERIELVERANRLRPRTWV